MSATSRRTIPLVTAASAVLAIILFALVFGFDLLGPSAPLWLNPPNDMAAATVGWLAVVQGPWTFPPTVSHAIIAPTAVSMVYSDSIPIFSLVLKALGLGAHTHVLGVFILASYILQPISMIAVLRACGVRRVLTLVLGAAFSLLYPAWLMMLLGHISLAGHWILLLALALAIGSARNGLTRWRAAGFAGLAVLSVGIHIYHLVPVAACLGAAILSDLLSRGRPAAGRSALAGVGFAVACALSAILFGYAVGRPESGGGAALGHYSMNILGPLIPQSSALFGQTFDGVGFTGVFDPNGGQAYEGYNYLGAGALLLIAVAVVAAIVRRRSAPDALRQFGPLVLALVALTLFAIGPQPYLGSKRIADLGQPGGQLGEWIGFFRCHGRFFWTAGYALIAWALMALDERLSWRWLAAVGGVALALQVYDTSELHRGLRASFDKRYQDFYPASFRTAPQLEKRDWRIYPTFACAEEPATRAWASQLSVLALQRHGSTNAAPTARSPAGVDCAPPLETLNTATAGSRLLTVLLPGEASAKVLPPFASRRDCYHFQGGFLCGAGLDGMEGVAPVDAASFAPRTVARTILLNAGVKPPELTSGWSVAEPNGIWSDGRRAVITLPASDIAGQSSIVLELSAIGYDPPPIDDPQRVEVWVGGKRVGTWRVQGMFESHLAVLPTQGLPAGQPLRVELVLLNPGSPATDTPGSPDRRLLGIAVNRLRILR